MPNFGIEFYYYNNANNNLRVISSLFFKDLLIFYLSYYKHKISFGISSI